MNRHRMRGAILPFSGFILMAMLSLLPSVARAYHDQGYPCYQCHSLKPSEIRVGSNAIRIDQPVLSPVPTPSGSAAWTGGMPITCDFCHKALDDVPAANFAAKANRHPVRTIMDNNPVSNEIACGDCHNADVNGNGTKDLAPATMTTKTTTDGYPDHDNVTAGYAHDLTSNLPHLTVPYWGASLPGATRGNDTTFWTNVRLGTQDMVCWVCHEGAGRTNAPTRAPLTNAVSTRLVKQDYFGAGRARGHQIRTNAGGSQLGVGAALPCYDCHDSHGSVNNGLVLDNQSIYGTNTSQVAITTFTGANDLVVCSQCHDTGNPQTAATMVSGIGKPVEGLHPVDPYNSAVYGALHVGSGIADNMLLSTRTCLANNGGCHANPHNPVGESVGGLNCGVCHGDILAAMDGGSSTGYHHVMLADNSPIAGLYPTNPTPTSTAADRMCIICHVDHALFSPQVVPSYSRARNLRRDITQQPDNLTNTPLSADYDNTLARGGICTSCHENRQTKRNPGTDIKNDGSTYTPLVSKSLFGASAHNYPSSAPFVESRFRADNTLFQSNCTKCHNDTSSRKFQDNTMFQFSLHASDGASAVNRLLAPLGITPLTDNLSENFCYRCHSRATDPVPGVRKITGGSDWYNNRAMSAASEDPWASFQRASRHPVSAADQAGGTRVVDCLNCHNVHLVGRPSDNTVVSNPDNTYASVAGWNADGTGPAAQSAFCLSCHDGSPPAYQLSTSVYVPADVRVSSAGMNKTAYAARAHWTDNQGQIFNNAGVACTTCHDKHGGSFGKLLDNSVLYHDVPVEPSALCLVCHGFSTGPPASGNNNTYCFRCHTQDQGESPNGYPPTEADRSAADNGYFSLAPTPARFSVRWPGRLAYEGSFSPHGSSTKTFSGFDTVSRTVGSCNTCHDVHGTANPYNELKDTFRAGSYTFCFRCHGLAGSVAADNIAGSFPTAAGGVSNDCAATTNVGHNVKSSGGYLAPRTALPCYDCHGVHGSATGNTQLKSDQRWSGLGNTKYGSTPSDNAADGASRIFCLGCHSAIDNAVAGTVENLNRQAGRLKLPAVNPIAEHFQASSQGCHRCHYGYNYNDNSFGPHYPGTGLCDTCHESQGARSAAAATYNGAHRTHTDNTAYRFACRQCHTWTAPQSPAVHKNDGNATQHAEVRFDNQAVSGWNLIQYATVTQYEYRSIYANPFGAASAPSYTAGADNTTPDGRRASVRWTNGTCGQVWCHSNASPIGGLGAGNVYQSPAWMDNSLRTDCTGCHGGDRSAVYLIGDNGAALNGSVAHRKHVAGNIGCSKCHSGTVQTSNNRLVSVLDNHVNGAKDVRFSSDVGGTWDNGNKTCAATYCHGSPAPLPKWDNLATVAGCAVCHSSQTIMSPTDNNGVHRTHTDNTAYRFACEACHANNATDNNATHAGGDADNAASFMVAEIRFTDNASIRSYYGRQYYSEDLRHNPYLGGAAVVPAYAAGGSLAGNDAINPPMSWTAGTCTTVWCHGNANPASAGGGANTFRTPRWDNALTCTSCHLGRDGMANMQSAPDRMSFGHQYHLPTDFYYATCDECHANTVPNDCTTAILSPGGYAFHVNGDKRDIRGSTSVKQSSVVNDAFVYDNNHDCTNNYCHSNGRSQSPPFSRGLRSPSFRFTWDNAMSPGCTGSNVCHPSSNSFADQSFTADGDNSAHTRHHYVCSGCHTTTIPDPYGTNGSGLHVNGVKDVTMIGSYDNDLVPNNNYDIPTKTCSAIACHGGKPVAWTDNNLTCASCHTTTNGDNVSTNRYEFVFGTAGAPNMSKVSPGLYQTRGHGSTDNLPWTGGTNPYALFGRAIVCLDCHDMAAPHTADNNAGNFFRFRATINGRAVASDNVDTVCYACHDSGAVKSHATAVTGGGTSAWQHAQKCVDCHDVHGQSNIFMICDNIVYQDNTAAGYATSRGIGVPYYPASRSAVSFTNASGGADFASTDNAAPFSGICEVCHERTAQYRRTGALTGPNGHSTGTCTGCHKHDGGFKGAGGPDVEQYFDGTYNAASATPGTENFDDRSRHPLTNGSTSASLLFGGTENCLACHGAKYKSSGVTHYANECLKCHFEHVSGSNPTLDGTRHMNRAIELSTISGNGLPGSRYAIATLTDYDNWCLQCHGGTTVTLNGVAPSGARGTYIDNAAFANGRHRARTVGCVYCHQPHGRGNAMIVRENPQNRRSAGTIPTMFGVYPADNTGSYGFPANQNLSFRARQYWSNGTLPYLPEADDDQGFCNMACHVARLDGTYAKDKMIYRDGTTGNYQLTAANRKIYVVGGVQYTIDNIINLIPNSHQHPNGDVIATDNMVQYFAGRNNISGPSYYKYPMTNDGHPSSYNPATSDLPLSPDYIDTSRDFTNAYNALGVRIAYRPTCSTCHDPHGNTLPNTPAGDGYPDLRLRKNNPNTLCLRCHK